MPATQRTSHVAPRTIDDPLRLAGFLLKEALLGGEVVTDFCQLA